MAGTILITGANSSLAIPAVDHLLSKYPEYTALLTVRNTSSAADVNTKKLEETIKRHAKATTSVRALDLGDLAAVHAFADAVAAEVRDKKLPPLAGIVCNAFYWNLNADAQQTGDGLDRTMQVNYVAHFALVLRLLGSFAPGGRVVFLASDTHEPGKAPFEKYPPTLPDDLDELNKPDAAGDTDKMGRGFYRYSVSKLAVIASTYALNRYLEKEADLSSITAVAINPGALADSRAFQTNVPLFLSLMQRLVMKPFRPLLRLKDPTMRTAAIAAIDVIDLAVGKANPGERGYFTLLVKDNSSKESMDKEKQEKLWAKSLVWARITRENTALKTAFAPS